MYKDCRSDILRERQRRSTEYKLSISENAKPVATNGAGERALAQGKIIQPNARTDTGIHKLFDMK